MGNIIKFICCFKYYNMNRIKYLSFFVTLLIVSCGQDSETAKQNGFNLYDKEEFHNAIIEFDKVIKINENDLSAYYYRGLSYFNLDLYDKAKPDFVKVISLDKNDTASYCFKGVCNVHQKNYEEAIQDLSFYLENNKENPIAYYYRASSYAGLFEYNKALEDYFIAVELDSNYISAYYMIGQIKNSMGDKNEGCNYITKAMQMGSKEAEDYYYNYCITYFDIKLVKVWKDYGIPKIKFELKNNYNQSITKCWFSVSLIDKDGEYLGSKERLHFYNIKRNGRSVEDLGWVTTENIRISDIKTIFIEPNILEIEGEDFKFDTKYFQILENKYNINVTF